MNNIVDIFLGVSIVLNVLLLISRLIKHVKDSRFTGELDVAEMTIDTPALGLRLHFNPYEAKDGDKAVVTIHRK